MPHNKQNSFIQAIEIHLRIEQTTILDDINFQLSEGESLAITGSSGSGKTSLGKILAGITPASHGDLLFPAKMKRLMVDQQDHFITQSGKRSTYYSQRYENIGEDDSPEVITYLSTIQEKSGSSKNKIHLNEIMDQMHITSIANRKLLHLSNGERKRTQLASALLQEPDLLILDQAFEGLDTTSREDLTNTIGQLTKNGISLILICDYKHIPDTIHKVLELENGKITQFINRANYFPSIKDPNILSKKSNANLFDLLPPPKEKYNEVVKMTNVKVVFGEKEILKNINWQVNEGEQWALLGPNGAGKTTLLSLITADNPQAYSNKLTLFDRKRGSGETIWEIKKRIGFVSPELHLYFLRGGGIHNSVPGLGEKSHTNYDALSCIDVIVSGFRDEIGMVSTTTSHQSKIASMWLSIFALEHLQNRKFHQASLGEQRCLLLARALVKSPTLLILDEPCQGLDPAQTKHFVRILDMICLQIKTTLIYVTHLKEELPSCINNCLQLENGEVIECGSVVQ